MHEHTPVAITCVRTRCLAMSHSHVVETSGVPQPAETRIANAAERGEQAAKRMQDYDERDEAKTVKLTFDLRWPSGACIRRYDNEADLDVERFTQDMDEGLIDGIPPAETDEDGVWREMYALLHDNVMMKCGQKFSHYAIPHNATLTVVKVTLV